MDVPSVIQRLIDALNAHDIDDFVSCFDPSYTSEQPAHPNRGFGGRDQVRRNWSGMFEGIPDFHAELLRWGEGDDAGWAEWHWTGTRANQGPFDFRGVTLFGIQDDRIVWGRLYMEEVEQAGTGIDESVRQISGRS